MCVVNIAGNKRTGDVGSLDGVPHWFKGLSELHFLFSRASHREEFAGQPLQYATYLVHIDGLGVAQLAYPGTSIFGEFNDALGGEVADRISNAGAADAVTLGELSLNELDPWRVLAVR